MATNRHPIQHPHRGRLNHAQEMTLRYGEDPRWDAFQSEAEHREAWARNRDHLLARYQHGRRPAAWWRFEASIPFPGYDHEQAALFEADLLHEDERAELEREWRRAFEQARAPGFMFCAGFAKPSDTTATWLEGEAAERAHLKWAGVPRALIRKWTAERKRRGKTVRALEAASVPGGANRGSAVSTEAQIQELARYIYEQTIIVAQAHANIRDAERKMGELIEQQEKQTGLKF